jgi:hypothetical protein
MVYESRTDKDWEKYLPIIHRIYMTQTHKSTGAAPATLLYGSAVQLERGLFPIAKAKEGTTASSNSVNTNRDSSWIEKLQEKQNELLAIAQTHQRDLDAENLAERTANSGTITEFPIGSYVLALYNDNHAFGKGRPPSKLSTIKRGPYRVISHTLNTYKVQSLAHESTIMEIHVKNLTPFIYDANHVDPFTVSLGDEQEFVVERIIGHELRDKPGVARKQLFLHIKWEGYGDEHNSWEPVNGLFHLPLTKDYLRANKGLSTYIPKTGRDNPEQNLRPRRYKANK